MGVHELGVKKDNGERFVNACVLNNIVIGGMRVNTQHNK